MKNEDEIVRDEWRQFALDDLESAKVLLEKTNNHHISSYHSHQAAEKIFKWFLVKSGKKFPFIHDLKELFRQINQFRKIESLLDDVLFLDNLYPQLRYPTGEQVTQGEARKCLAAAEKIVKEITG
ncbi:MAG: HEPN domain-containing protein [Candidatus Margulisiibacteriota bacterium]